ncbi:glycosyltransferase [Salinicola halophilus]|uniref:glycosyltransferase n=1 Tax=Salinicola halophilus TaxID=184065 RepID=UPI000DA2198C|nr:glycosyltransferase [Salinicola halophilus]
MLALPSLSVLITVTDATHRVQSLVREASCALRHARALEFIVVDDATASPTAAALARLAESDPRVRVLRQRTAIGKDAALWRACESARSEWVVTLDATGRDDPYDLPEMFCHALHQGLTLIHGRALAPSGYRKRLAAWASACGIHRGDTHHGMRLVRQAALVSLPVMPGLERYLPLLVARQGGLIERHPAHVRPGTRPPARAFYRWPLEMLGTARDRLGVAWFSRRLRPLCASRPRTSPASRPRAYAR